ncbi:hypothetical protein [Desulfofustis glycolicus]|uniref:Uncharacterized protein n=1 Tax=Desulfofustis glycolicus DSM 9705 TaxID=1121409 RepID=A0A1M5YRF3_9BACT|nr:hypothetical protein [Desulfofustis glycolicus]MCB2218719.1 hypothetical protein [Desulfobulbaceae bacterium]SHI14622.1 hypothetical protein SAMN02745124_04365 [Desulfofustis glycolicus DSM 9705]
MKIPKILTLLLCLLALFVFTACESEGPAEQAGEKIDNAVEEAQEGLEEAGDAIEDTAEEAGEKIEDAGDKVRN